MYSLDTPSHFAHHVPRVSVVSSRPRNEHVLFFSAPTARWCHKGGYQNCRFAARDHCIGAVALTIASELDPPHMGLRFQPNSCHHAMRAHDSTPVRFAAMLLLLPMHRSIKFFVLAPRGATIGEQAHPMTKRRSGAVSSAPLCFSLALQEQSSVRLGRVQRVTARGSSSRRG